MMPSDHTRRKDDTWTSAELNRALKSSKGDMLRKKRSDDEGSRRRHTEDINGSGLRGDRDKRSHRRDEDEKQSRRHKDRGDSADRVALTEEERERLRQERRAKREGVNEEKKPKSKVSKSVKIIEDADDGVRKQRPRDKEEGRYLEQKHHHNEEAQKLHRSEEPRKHRDGKEGERRKHREDDTPDIQPHRSTNVSDSKPRHQREEGSLPRKQQDETNRHRRHEDNRDRHVVTEEEARYRSRKNKNDDDDEEEREKRRKERREKREKETLKDKEKDQEKSQGRHKESEKSDKVRSKDNEKDKKRHHSRDAYPDNDNRDRDRDLRYEVEKRSSRHREMEQEPERGSSRHKNVNRELGKPDRRDHEEDAQVFSSSNSKHRKETRKTDSNDDDDNNDDEYNYEEDFEDYEDDFEDEDDTHGKEEEELVGVLRTLNEENNKLAASSQKSDQSDSPEPSERHHRRDDLKTRDAAARPKSFINFVSAKQRVLDQAMASKTQKRFDDLSRLIELDVVEYDMFDLPPVKEYEMYIRSFGRSDTTQAYVQTGDDDIEGEVQTDEIYSLSKWTQHPPGEEAAVGGEGINVHGSENSEEMVNKTDVVRLNQFLDRVGQFLFTILDEESKNCEDGTSKHDGRHVSFCSSAFQLGVPGALKGHQIVSLSFCQSEPNYLLSIHSTTQDNPEKNLSPLHSMHIICVWNLSQPTYPYRICGSQMRIICACFSPTKASLVIAGMHDGSVAAWDLREPASDHHRINVAGEEHLVRFPTYNTAQVLEPENHHSPVMSIVPVFSQIVGSQKDEDAAESSPGLSFQLASIEEKAVVNLWVVVETAASDPAGSEADLGLSPGGRIKLLRSSSIVLSNPDKYLSTTLELRALNLHLHPGDLNHFYVGTDTGHVVHGVRFGKRAYPPSHWSLGDSPVSIVSLDFSPFGLSYFLAGCDDGTLHLFSTKQENPISSWRGFILGRTIQHVRWSHSRPAVFFVLDDSSTIFTFDLVENGRGPIKVDKILSGSATFMDFGGDPGLLMPGTSRPPHMALALADGSIEMSTVSDDMRTQEPLEEEFMASFVDRY